jgi:D-lactate dehydrogenase
MRRADTEADFGLIEVMPTTTDVRSFMNVAVFDTHQFDREALEKANQSRHQLRFLQPQLTEDTALLAKGCNAVCLFANDRANAKALQTFKELGIRLVTLRSAGFNHVDLTAAHSLGLTVVRVPEYSPHAIAEFATGLLLTLNRKIHRAHNRVREMNFSLEGLVGFDIFEKQVGVVGTGRIGRVFCQIMRGFGCQVIAYDIQPDLAWAKMHGVDYVELSQLYQDSDVISLHAPLTPETRHLINAASIGTMKPSVILINTSRGALIEASALIDALKAHKIGGACLDVYEEESGIFFSDFSEVGIDDDLLARLLTFPNVLVTSHQAFLTREALQNIAQTTIQSLTRFEAGQDLSNVQVSLP